MLHVTNNNINFLDPNLFYPPPPPLGIAGVTEIVICHAIELDRMKKKSKNDKRFFLLCLPRRGS